MSKCIYYATTVDVSDFSAQSLQIRSMSHAFNKISRLDFKLYAFSSFETEYKASFPTRLLKTKKSKLIRSVYIFLCILFDKGTDYSIFTRDLYLALLFVLVGKNVIWEAHQETTGGAKRILKILNYFSSFKVLTISEALKCSNEITINKDKIYTYHDGVSLSEQYINNQKPVSFSNKNTAVYTGALHKGGDIESLEPLFDKFFDWDFLFIGGNDFDIKRYQRIFAKYKNVMFVGRLPHNEILRYQKSASVLLYPLTTTNKLWRYTSPLKLFEYMSSGRPIVGSNIGSVCEIIDERNAFVFKGDKGVVDAFERYLCSSKSAILDKISINIDLIENKYNWDKRVEFIVTDVLKLSAEC